MQDPKIEFLSSLADKLHTLGIRKERSTPDAFFYTSLLRRGEAKEILETCLRAVFDEALRVGYFRLPRGLGSLRVKTLKETAGILPRTGANFTVPSREKMRFMQGKEITDRLRGN